MAKVDGDPPQVIKVSKKDSLVIHLHKHLLQCWKEGAISKEMQILSLFKRIEEDCSDFYANVTL